MIKISISKLKLDQQLVYTNTLVNIRVYISFSCQYLPIKNF